MSKIDTLKTLISQYGGNIDNLVSNILPISEIQKTNLNWGSNGIGSRFCNSKVNYIVIYKNGSIRQYPNFIYDIDSFNIEKDKFLKNINSYEKGGIIGIKTFGLREVSNNRPISKKIRQW